MTPSRPCRLNSSDRDRCCNFSSATIPSSRAKAAMAFTIEALPEVRTDLGGKLLCNFHPVGWVTSQVIQRGVARTKIVDSYTDTFLTELRQDTFLFP